MQVSRQVNWIGADHFRAANPLTAAVASVTQEDNKGKRDLQIVFALDGQLDALVRMSLFGENLNRCISKWGSETDAWIGKRVQILREADVGGKEKKKLLPI